MELQQVKNILEALLLSADKPMDLRHLEKLFEVDEDDKPSKDQLEQALQSLQQDYQGRGMALTEVSSGYRIQVREDYAGWVGRLWEEKVPRYSRALLETLVLIAYRQPITRGEIEEIRGVSVSSQIMKTLQEREWVRVLGHKDVPGKPSMYGTTSSFLDYFNLKSLDELPPLSDIKDLDQLHPSLQLDEVQAVKDGDQGDEQSELAATAEAEIKEESSTGDSAQSDDGQENEIQDDEIQATDDRETDDQSAHIEAVDNTVQAQDVPVEPESQALSQGDAEPVAFAEELEPEQPDRQPSDDGEIEMADETRAGANDDDSDQDSVKLNDQSQNADDVVRDEAFEEEREQPVEPAEQVAETNDEDEPPSMFESQPKPETNEAEVISGETKAMDDPVLDIPVDIEAMNDETTDAPDDVQEPEIEDCLPDVEESELESVSEPEPEPEPEPEQEEQTLLHEPTEETSDLDEKEAEGASTEQDAAAESGGRGWTKLAQMLWERLKKLMQKGRKRLEPDYNLGSQWV